MPPDTTKGKLKRKSSRREGDDFRFDGGHAREIEQKRNNGQISCAECRRCDLRTIFIEVSLGQSDMMMCVCLKAQDKV
jgi:hypothetical protein